MRLAMRRVLVLLPLAVLFGCSTIPSPPPTPEPSPTASAQPTPETIAIACGPLADDPPDCAAALEAAIRLKDPAVNWSSARVDSGEETCAGVTTPCRAPTVVVSFLSEDSALAVDEVPLAGGDGEWISMAAIR
jgi:hypothetical protein